MLHKAHISNRSGVSIPEMLTAMLLVGLLMTTTFYIFSTFFSASMSQQRQTMEQSDTQVGTQFIKWDIFMAGFGMPGDVQSIGAIDNSGVNNSDILMVSSTAFGPGGNTGKWSYMLIPTSGTNQITIRRWNDAAQDVAVGEYIVVISATKGRVGLPSYQITNRQSATGPAAQTAWLLTLNNTISSSLNFIYVLCCPTGPATTTYQIQNGNLMRDTTVFIPGVDDFQVAYWIDTDGDRIQDVGETYNDLSILAMNPQFVDNIKLARLTVVTATRGNKGYRFSQGSITVENHTQTLSLDRRNFRYDMWQNLINPRNL